MRCLVTGAGGFIGGHLVNRLIRDGHEVRAVDVKPLKEWCQHNNRAEEIVANLTGEFECRLVCRDIDHVYNLAADMGGMGFIEKHKADCMLSVLISTHMLVAACEGNVERFFYSSSACVYAADKQTDQNVTALKEADAYPAMPEDGYGWEKLFSERMARHFWEDYDFLTRVARFHNVYGPHGTFDGGREKAPAALCRKIIQAKLDGSGEIEIWGDGEQTRSFMYVDDCVEGTIKIMDSDILYPINLGSSELVSINKLVDIIEEIAEFKVARSYDTSAPQGVRGRNSDNSLITAELDWQPSITLRDGLAQTFEWICHEITGSTTL